MIKNMGKIYNEIGVFSYGYAPFKIIYPALVKCGWIDKELNELTSEVYNYTGDFVNEFARFKKGDKWGWMGLNGQSLTEILFDNVWNFGDDGYASFKDGNKSGKVDKLGNIYYKN